MQTRHPPLTRGRAEEADGFAHHVHRNEHRQLALLVRDPLQRKQIGVALGGDAADHPMIWR